MEKKPKENSAAAKKPYRAPKLVMYGEVRRLTQGGLTGSNEGAAMLMSQMVQSDRALKESVVRVGTHPLGIGLYLYNYKPAFRDRLGHGRQFGVMADEVETALPDAVGVGDDGFRCVDYARLGIALAGRQG
jgi:hypothetical protein